MNFKQNLASIWKRPDEGRFTCVDGLRALSILWVIGFHWIFCLRFFMDPEIMAGWIRNNAFLRFLESGTLGVDVFFAISGFLIGHQLFREHRDFGTIGIRNFYVKRAFRLLPAYYATLFVWAFIAPENVENAWTNILYVNNFVPIKEQFMGWAWSLAIEEQFYLVAPLAIVPLFKLKTKPILVLTTLFGLSFIIRYWIAAETGVSYPSGADEEKLARYFDFIYDKPHTRYGGLLIGVIAAYLYLHTEIISHLDTHHSARRMLFVTSILAIGIVGLGPCAESFGTITKQFEASYLAVYRNVFSAGVSGLILYGLTDSGKTARLPRILGSRVWYPIAQLSYSAYLTHFIVIAVLYQTMAVNDTTALSTIAWYAPPVFILTFVISTVVYVTIEKPFLRLRSRFLRPIR